MEIAKLILDFIDALIYPALLVFVLITFKKELKSILSGELSAKYKDLSFTIKRKDEAIKAMEENVKEVSDAVQNEIERVRESEKWSGFDFEANRLSTAIKKIDLNSDEHMVLKFIKDKKGVSTVSELVNEIISPDKGMETHVFQAEKARLDFTLEGLMKKGVVSKSDKGNIKLHPWFGTLTKPSN